MHNPPTTVDDAGCHLGVVAVYTHGCNGSRAAVTRSKAGPPGPASTARATALWALRHTAHAISLDAGQTVTACLL